MNTMDRMNALLGDTMSSGPRRITLLVGAVLLAVTAAWLLARGGDATAAEPAAGPSPALTVTVVAPQATRWTRTLAATGSLEAWQEASVGAEVNGLRLAEVRVNVGDRVSRGEVLAVFDDATPQAEFAQAEAAVDEASARAAEAEANAARAKTLIDTGALSAQDLDQFSTGARTANAQLKAAIARRNAASLTLRRTKVVAPDAGVISARGATLGAVVPAGTELFRLIRQSRIEWRAEVPEHELPLVRRGQAVTIVTAQGSKLKGTVRAIAPTVDARKRTAMVYVDLPAAGGKAVAGMFAEGAFALGESAALTVPQSAVVLRDGLSYVFLVGEGNRVARVQVATGRRQGDRIEILKGMPQGARVVHAGAGFLNDGDLVRIATAAAPAAPAAPAKQGAKS